MQKLINELGNVTPESLIMILIIIIVLDITAGIIKAFVFDKSFTSEYLRKTIPEHLFSAILLPLLFYTNKYISHMDIVSVLYIPIFLWFTIAYVTSLLANIAIIGVPLPIHLITYLKKEIESKGAIIEVDKSGYKILKGNETFVQSNNDEDLKAIKKLFDLLNVQDVEKNIFDKLEENKNDLNDENKDNIVDKVVDKVDFENDKGEK